MKLSLSSLFLVVALIAVSVAWCLDRRKLSKEIVNLNAECADLMQDMAAMRMNQGVGALSFADGKLPPQRAYDFENPRDRKEYRKVYGHLMSRWGRFSDP